MIFLKIMTTTKENMNYCKQYMDLISRRTAMAVMIFVGVLFSASPLMAEEAGGDGQNDNSPEIIRTIANYDIPNVDVIRMDGKKLSFIKEMDDGRPVIMNYIFTSCSAICPMLSHVLSQVQVKLGKDSQKVHLVSISIDPENDTPAKLNEFAKKFGADSGWDFYTGTREASLAIQKAFNVYRGDKMNHSSVILMRAGPGKSWLRLQGFIGTDKVIQEYVAFGK